MRQKIVIGFLSVIVLFLGVYALAPQFKKEEPKYFIIVAKFADVHKYVVVRKAIGVHEVVKVNDRSFGHFNVGDSILHTGN